jgi:hypothetical protein
MAAQIIIILRRQQTGYVGAKLLDQCASYYYQVASFCAAEWQRRDKSFRPSQRNSGNVIKFLV